MKLGDYLESHKISHIKFGKQFDPVISGVCIGYWCNGRSIPRKKNMNDIKKITKNAVTEIDFYSGSN
jgi:hypothetical protein